MIGNQRADDRHARLAAMMCDDAFFDRCNLPGVELVHLLPDPVIHIAFSELEFLVAHPSRGDFFPRGETDYVP